MEAAEGSMRPRPTLELLEGVPMAQWVVHSWAQVKEFQAKSDDLLIATYPKAGTTWVQEIVDLILMGGDVQKTSRAPIYVRIPFLEIFTYGFHPNGLEQIESMESPRTIKTHLPVQLVPTSFWDQDCKVIVVARNAKDTAVSYYHFHRMNQVMPEPGTWEEFLQRFIEGQVSWGSWYDHNQGWWEARKKHQILFLFYEDMKENLQREILKLAEFLGKELEESVLRKVVHHSHFSQMKDNPMANYTTLPPTVFNQAVSKFMRKGEVGDWKNQFTVAQNEAFDDDYAQKMGESDLRFRETL